MDQQRSRRRPHRAVDAARRSGRLRRYREARAPPPRPHPQRRAAGGRRRGRRRAGRERGRRKPGRAGKRRRSEEHTSELQSLMRISYAVFCLKKKKDDSKRANKRNYNNYKRNTQAQCTSSKQTKKRENKK